MKQPSLLLKMTVLSSSMLLAGGCVSYRAGAFNWLFGPSERPAAAESNSSSDKKQTDDSAKPPTIMFGLKSPATGAANGLLEDITPADTAPPNVSPPDPRHQSRPHQQSCTDLKHLCSPWVTSYRQMSLLLLPNRRNQLHSREE